MTAVLLDSKSLSQNAPVQLNLHLVTTLQVTANDARRQVNRDIVAELGTGLVALDPELIVAETHIAWRVPIALSLPGLGDMGQVGIVDVDAQTGVVLADTAAQERIRQHARRLYAGATLQTE